MIMNQDNKYYIIILIKLNLILFNNYYKNKYQLIMNINQIIMNYKLN